MGLCWSKCSATVQPVSSRRDPVSVHPVIASWTTGLDENLGEPHQPGDGRTPTPSSEKTAGRSGAGSTSSINRRFAAVRPPRNAHPLAVRHLLGSTNKLTGSTRSLIESSPRRPAGPSPLASSSASKFWARSSTVLRADEGRPDDSRTVHRTASVGLESPEKLKKAMTRLFPNDCSDPAVPVGFHPLFHETEDEARCRGTASRLAPRKNETSTRNYVQQLLVDWKESGIVSEIENHALSVPATATTTIVGLASALTAPPAKYLTSVGKKVSHQQLAKAYAIYYWEARNICYNTSLLRVFQRGGYVDCMAQHVLQERTAICTGYANLFKALATRSGLEADVVHGNLKTWRIFMEDGFMGGGFEPQSSNSHSWNMISIDGVWFPVDCTLGTGSLVQLQFSPRFTRDYFACMPVRMALTHFPSDASWQLLHEPLALEELHPLIAPSVRALAEGVEPRVWSECVHVVDSSPDPVVQISVRTEAEVRLSATLKKASKFLTISDSTHRLADNDRSLDHKIFIQHTSDGFCVFVALSHPGHYSLNLYSCKRQHQDTHREQQYQLCLSYLLSCDKVTNVHIGYPSVFTLAAEAFEFRLLYWNKPQKAYVCENDEGRLAVAFQAKPGLCFFHCLLSGKVANPTAMAKSSPLHYCTMVNHSLPDPSLYFLHALFPAEGWWTVYLCATPPVASTSSTVGYTALLSYSVFARRGQEEKSYPHTFSPDVSFGSSAPMSASGDDVLVVPFTSPRDYAFHCYLTFEQPTGTSREDVVMIKKSESVPGTNTYSLRVIFPSPGKWYVHVFGKDRQDPQAKSYVVLFDLCLEIKGCLNGTFPHLTPTATEMGVTLLSDEPVPCVSDGHPFTLQFLAPNEVDFTHSVELMSADTAPDPFLQHCVILSPASLSLSPCLYTLRGLFPYSGKWLVKLFAAAQSQRDSFVLAVQITVEVKMPSPGVSFLNLYPDFHRLGLTVSEDQLTYNTSQDSPNFTLSFSAPEGLSFACVLQNIITEKKFYHNAIVLPSAEGVEMTGQVLRAIFPQKGVWLLQLFAQQQQQQQDEESATRKSSYSSVLELRVQAQAYLSDYTFPQIFKPFKSQFGLALDGGSLPLVSVINTVPYTLTIPFHSPPGVRFWHDAEITNNPGTDQYTTRMTSNRVTGHHELMMEVIEGGEWTLSLYAQLEHATTKNWTAVLRHVVTAQFQARKKSVVDSLWD